MDWMQTLKAVFALAIVLGLILGLSAVLRRYGPQFMARVQAKAGRKRLSVIETLVLDPARRLVLIRVDDEERLILLGEGRDLGAPRLGAQTAQAIQADRVAKPAPNSAASPDDELF